MRAQIFSMDFIIAMAILTVVIGITLQTVDNLQKRVQFIERGQTNNAEVIAQTWVKNASGFENATKYCFLYSNRTGNCNAFSCPDPNFMFTATRFVACRAAGVTTPCTITIRTCE
ncbi:MAG TPA: hypothetical protein VJI13_00180 [Candidatus Norongarragalinales archaeon]|nr:hypothetical protein [Candidatus Norongarragalinales archaeon]